MNTSTLTLLLTCFTPSLAWLGYFYIRDERDRGPLHLVLLMFAGGLIAGPVSLLLFEGLESVAFYKDLATIDLLPDYKILTYSLFGIGVVEELSKFLVFWTLVGRKHIPFNSPMDGVVYAAAAALGFATIENWYFMAAVDEPIWSRAITLPFNHVLFSSFWGVGLGLARTQGRSSRVVVQGIALAIVFHGLYDYILFSASVPNLMIGPLIVALWLWVSLAIRRLINLPALDQNSHLMVP